MGDGGRIYATEFGKFYKFGLLFLFWFFPFVVIVYQGNPLPQLPESNHSDAEETPGQGENATQSKYKEFSPNPWSTAPDLKAGQQGSLIL